MGLLLPFAYFGTASATFLYRVHAENSAGSHVALTAFPAPTPHDRVLIFSPHPDDETLGCGGLIQQAREAGDPVRVVMITNGDGFRVAVERQYRTLQVQPDDYVRFAALRQKECRKALGVLGLSPDDVTFLGYPDRGLARLWADHWGSRDPFVSPYTRQGHSPYEIAYRKGTVYSGEALLADIKRVLAESEPTDVYVTHPSDDHPDHSAASSFVQLALLEAREAGATWARQCRLHFYLVHRGDWPVPQGLDTHSPLGPPRELAELDTSWRSRAIDPEQVDRKERAILAYKSQTAIMKRFLLSFARRTEFFGELPHEAVPRVSDGTALLEAGAAAWGATSPVIEDPVNDNLLRDFQGAADIKSVYAGRDAGTLVVRVVTSKPITDRVEVKVNLRYFGDREHGQAGGAFAVDLRSPKGVTPSDLSAVIRGNSAEVAIPLRDLSYARNVAIGVETRFAGIQVDKTGYRFLAL